MNKIYYNYIEPPRMVRITSESLCLDYTFSPLGSKQCLGIGDFMKISKMFFVDSVKMYLTEENEAYFYLDDNKKCFLTGWVDMNEFCFLDDGGDISNDPRSLIN